MTRAHESRIVCDIDLAAPGKRFGRLRLFHSVHRSAYGFVPIPIVVVSGAPGPTVLVIGGNHGDEYEGQIIAAELAGTLQPEAVRGRVIILPALNLPAAQAGTRTSPLDGGNLNRCFPGDPTGMPTAQIAFHVEHVLLPQCDLVIDLHSGGSSLEYVPSAMALGESGRVGDASRAALRSFGGPVGILLPPARPGEPTLWGAASRAGVTFLGTELGGGGRATPQGLAVGRAGVASVLADHGLIDAASARRDGRPLVDLAQGDPGLYADDHGVFEPMVAPGERVVTAQLVGVVHRPDTPGRAAVTVAAPRDGLVLCIRAIGRIAPGDCLAQVAATLQT